MTGMHPTRTEIADYTLAVERHLTDLPVSIRRDLLSDLEAHLGEVAIELRAGERLTDRIGGPEAYAGELREATGIERAPLTERWYRGLWTMTDPTLNGAKIAVDRFTASAGVGRAADFRKSLKPGWWVLRGLIAATMAWYFLVSAGVSETLPVLRSGPFLLVFAIGGGLLLVWLSLRLGVSSEQWGRNGRWATAIGGTALVLIFLASFSWVPGHLIDDFGSSSVVYVEPSATPTETTSEAPAQD